MLDSLTLAYPTSRLTVMLPETWEAMSKDLGESRSVKYTVPSHLYPSSMPFTGQPALLSPSSVLSWSRSTYQALSFRNILPFHARCPQWDGRTRIQCNFRNSGTLTRAVPRLIAVLNAFGVSVAIVLTGCNVRYARIGSHEIIVETTL